MATFHAACENCGNYFISNDYRKKFCSDSCADNYFKINKICEECNRPFSTTREIAKFCSKDCANINKGKKMSEANQADGNWYRCTTCGEVKPANAFSCVVRSDYSSGRRSQCKQCGHTEQERERRERTWKNDAVTVLLSNSRQRAKRSNLENNLTREDIIIPDKCPVFDIPLKREDKSTWNNAPSIDRIDNTKGYTKDNIIIVSRRANILKKDASIDELTQMADFYSKLKKDHK